MLDLLETYLSGRGYEYCRLDGSTNRVQRTVDINAFNMAGTYILTYSLTHSLTHLLTYLVTYSLTD